VPQSIIKEDPISQLIALGNKKRAIQSQSFFKTGPGQYGAGDRFLGLNAKTLHQFAKKHCLDSVTAIRAYVRSPYHEVRMFGLLCLVYRFEKSDAEQRQKIFAVYVSLFKYINNWDFVDCSAPKIVGEYLLDQKRDILYQWAAARSFWTRRIAMLATLTFIRNFEYSDTLALADVLLNDPEDLIHKAVGWMLREIGKRDLARLNSFLAPRYQRMPRTMLRYAIEKHPHSERLAYLKSSI